MRRVSELEEWWPIADLNHTPARANRVGPTHCIACGCPKPQVMVLPSHGSYVIENVTPVDASHRLISIGGGVLIALPYPPGRIDFEEVARPLRWLEVGYKRLAVGCGRWEE